MFTYELHSLNLPKLSGIGLDLFTTLLENPASRSLLIGNLLENGGIPKLRRKQINEPPTFYPMEKPRELVQHKAHPVKLEGLPENFPFRTIHEYAKAYRQGVTDPLEIAGKVLSAVEKSNQGPAPLNTFISIQPSDVIAQAKISYERIKSGKPLSELDGIPVGIKDEVDMLPYPTTVGTKFLGKQPALEDSTAVARLRAAGALLIGKTNMHEIGINPNGSNVNFGLVRNPYSENKDPGGSSSGSAAAVAAGLVPLALGADGGGSIRIPAALCGLVGLKPTYGRVSEQGAAPLCWSVAHLGPIAACVEDCVLGYSLMSGPDLRDPHTLIQPPLTLNGWNQTDLHGLRLGIYRDWFQHAAPEIVKSCSDLLDQFKSAGADIQEIIIPELEEMRIAHAITILAEMAACMKSYAENRRDHGSAVRLSLVLGEEFSATDYLQAQRMRTRALNIFAEIFNRVDLILTPTTAQTAQPIPVNNKNHGWSDLGTDTEMMRFIIPGNLAGLPAISFPAGYDSSGLPIGLQAIGRHWEEHLLFKLAYTAEKVVYRNLPARYYPIF